MRNVDKIRTLENQNELLKTQVEGMKRLKAQYDNLQKVHDALHVTNNAVMIAVTLLCGEEISEGYKLILPKVEVEVLLREYEIHSERGADNRLIITVKRREADAEDELQGPETAGGERKGESTEDTEV